MKLLTRWLLLLAILFSTVNFLLIFRLSFKDTRIYQVPDANFYIAANYFNSENSLYYSLPEISKLIDTLNTGSNIFVSFFENGSTDKTGAMLQQWASTLTIPHSVVTCNSLGSDRWQTPNQISPNFAPKRYRRMASLRNIAMKYLDSNTFSDKSRPTYIIFLNDIYFHASDVLEVLHTNSGDFDIACPMDFYYRFYDMLVTRDIEGYWFSDNYPFTRHKPSQDLLQQNKEFRVFSCWNGFAVLNAEPFLQHSVSFRGRSYNRDEGLCECVQSECLLLSVDYWRLGYNKIFINPRVRVSYEWKYWIMHNLPIVSDVMYWLQSWEYHWNEETWGYELDKIACGMPPYWNEATPRLYMSLNATECDIPFDEFKPQREWNANMTLREQHFTEKFYNRLISSCLGS